MTIPSDRLRPVIGKQMADIRREWDQIAKLRLDQISEGRDVSYSHVLEPTILRLIQSCNRTAVLDVGCGVGVLTARLAEISQNVVGIDISAESIHLAKEHGQCKGNLRFSASSVEVFASHAQERFSAIVTNMVLMTVLDLPTTLAAVVRLLAPDGRFILTITHPCFWPRYWNYEQQDWFEYGKEIPIEGPFRISAESPTSFITTHVHRPLAQYFDAFSDCGLVVLSAAEPWPENDAPQEYLRTWRFPRFLAMVCSLKLP